MTLPAKKRLRNTDMTEWPVCQGTSETPTPGPFLTCSRLHDWFVKCLEQATSWEQSRAGAWVPWAST